MALRSDITNPKLGFLNKLRRGEKVLAAWAQLKGVRNAQVLANTGVDVVMIDCEHGNIDDSEMHDMVATVAGTGASPGIRVRGFSPDILERALDTGTHAILVPMVGTAHMAREIVKISKYPPEGERGQGAPWAWLTQGLPTPGDYIRQANDTVLIMLQIETAEGIQNIDEICQVPGIDVVVIGPADLSLSLLGYAPPKSTDTVFSEAMDKVVEAARRHGVKVGVGVQDGQAAKHAMERFDLVILPSEVKAAQAWYKDHIQVARS